METKLLSSNDNDLKIAAEILKQGGNVIFPTETVYGLGADAKNPNAVQNIFKAKGRPSDNPLIVHIASSEMLNGVVEDVSQKAKELTDKFWPGPLTVILKKDKSIPNVTTGNLDTVAVRMPENKTALKLIEFSGIPIAAPSANLSGKPSPTTFKHCVNDMESRVDAIIEGEDCKIGVESTVIDLSCEPPVILRPGAVTYEEICETIGEVKIGDKLKDGEKPKSPGLKYKHYSPDAKVVILSGEKEKKLEYIKKAGESRRVGVLDFEENPIYSGAIFISLGKSTDSLSASHNLFNALREMDKQGVDIVFAPEISDDGVWRAVKNRLYRAAGEEVVYLDKLKRILFVCTGNTCRSPMAESIFNKMCFEKGVYALADSTGIYSDGSKKSQNAIKVLSELSISPSEEFSKQIKAEDIEKSNLILTMTESHKNLLISKFGYNDKIKTLGEFSEIGTDVPDPFGGNTDIYRACRDVIYELVCKAIDKL